MAKTIETRTGTVAFGDHETHYRIVGDLSTGTPLLVLHGGPGVPHDYLRSIERLAAADRAVVFYDQVGCGASSQPDAPALWTLDFFTDELANLRRALGLGRVHLLGHSWGGILALEHALRDPQGVATLILSDTTASMPLHAQEVSRLRAGLPPTIQKTLDRHEKNGTTSSPEYEEATMAFYGRHICRLEPWPDALLMAFGNLNPQVYGALWGENELRLTGALKDWDVRARLGEIRAPTLILGGRHDEMTPREQLVLHEGIKDSEHIVFEESAHLPFLEEPEAYFSAIEGFLARRAVATPARTV